MNPLELLKTHTDWDNCGVWFENITDHEYHEGTPEFLSRSTLLKHRRSHFHAELKKEETAALHFGKVSHAHFLEKELFWKKHAIAPVVNKRTKAGKEEWAAFEASCENNFITPIEQSTVDILEAMERKRTQNQVVQALMNDCTFEEAFFFKEPVTGTFGKAKLDIRNDKQRYIVDFKTSTDASYIAFERDLAKYMYHVQAAWYLDAINYCCPPDLDRDEAPYQDFIFVVQEKVEPYEIAIYHLDHNAIEAGRELYQKILMNKIQRERKGNFGYPKIVQTISLPNWALESTRFL